MTACTKISCFPTNQASRTGLSAFVTAAAIVQLAIRSNMKCQVKYFVSLIQQSSRNCMPCWLKGPIAESKKRCFHRKKQTQGTLQLDCCGRRLRDCTAQNCRSYSSQNPSSAANTSTPLHP